MGKNVKTLGSLRWLQLSKGKYLAFCRLCNSQCGGQRFNSVMRTRPVQFGQLRQLGLVNEQINWKQRFFIPTDETIGVTTLSSLLAQYPIVASTEAEPMQTVMVEASNDPPLCNMIDLNEWIIDASTKTTIDEIDRVNEDQRAADREIITTERPLSVTSVEVPVEETQQHAPMPWLGQATTATQLAFSFT